MGSNKLNSVIREYGHRNYLEGALLGLVGGLTSAGTIELYGHDYGDAAKWLIAGGITLGLGVSALRKSSLRRVEELEVGLLEELKESLENKLSQ